MDELGRFLRGAGNRVREDNRRYYLEDWLSKPLYVFYSIMDVDRGTIDFIRDYYWDNGTGGYIRHFMLYVADLLVLFEGLVEEEVGCYDGKEIILSEPKSFEDFDENRIFLEFEYIMDVGIDYRELYLGERREDGLSIRLVKECDNCEVIRGFDGKHEKVESDSSAYWVLGGLIMCFMVNNKVDRVHALVDRLIRKLDYC